MSKNVRFHNNVKITIERGSEKIVDRQFDKGALYPVVKARQNGDKYIFIFDIKGHNWRGEYDVSQGMDFELGFREEDEVANSPSWDQTDMQVLQSVDKHFVKSSITAKPRRGFKPYKSEAEFFEDLEKLDED